jgi:hypothetical protein
MTPSSIHPRQRNGEGEVNGRWVIEAAPCPFGLHTAGTIVADPAPLGTDWSLTFTASNGKVYWDTPEHTQWTPREAA